MKNVRKPAVAGAFYPGEENQLSVMIDEALTNAVNFVTKGDLKAIIVPHAGYIYSGVVAAAGYKLLGDLNKRKKWKVLLLGPSHNDLFHGAAAPEIEGWETPLGVVPVKSIIDEIKDSSLIIPAEDVFTSEHSLEVQVPFLQTVMKNFTLYPLCLGDVNPEGLATQLNDFANQEDVIVVVSSDLSHYYSYDDAKVLDDNANKFIPVKAIAEVRDRVEACGLSGILTLLNLAEMNRWDGHFIDYKNSGDTAGDKSQVVGYGCYAFTK